MAQPRLTVGANSPALLTAALIVFAAFALVTPAAHSQSFQVIHDFTDGTDGATPMGRLTIDAGGHLYGTTYSGGTRLDGGQGLVFRMSLHSSNWTLAPIYTFNQQSSGTDPYSGVLFGPDGKLYGTTANGTSVFAIQPPLSVPRTVLSPWKVDYVYSGFANFVFPSGDVIFDHAGNIYGATWTGGNHGCFNNEGCGMVYELTPSAGGWTMTPLYVFQGGADGQAPTGVVFDSAGDLIGTASSGGANSQGVIFKLTSTGSGWTENVIYNFSCGTGPGCVPEAALTPDGAGNFYGSTTAGFGYSGAIFELSPSNGGWSVNMLAGIPQQYQTGPFAPLTMDTAGNLYGTIGSYSYNPLGAVFKATHGSGGWTFTSLHDFTGGDDGAAPESTVAIGADGKLYGTASRGGTCGGTGCGTVWQITP